VIVNLTSKQEKFAQSVSQGSTLSDAYRQYYSTKNMKDKSINELACVVMRNTKVSSRVNELKALIATQVITNTAYTLVEHMRELDEIKDLAIDKKGYVGKDADEVDNPDLGTALRAIQSKGQVSGHYEKTLILQQFNTNINNITSIENITNNMDDLVFEDAQI